MRRLIRRLCHEPALRTPARSLGLDQERAAAFDCNRHVKRLSSSAQRSTLWPCAAACHVTSRDAVAASAAPQPLHTHLFASRVSNGPLPRPDAAQSQLERR
eukprot:6178822-Pleurochrysis_carterae.AAC.3